MRPPSISGLIDVGVDLLATAVSAATGRVFAQTGNVAAETSDSDGVEWLQHVGFISRPPKPQEGKQAAQGVVIKSSDRDVCIASVDNRGLSLAGNLDHGETCVYAAGEDGNAQGRIVLKDNGSVTLFTKVGNTEEGKGVFFRVAPDGLSFVAPWGMIKFDETGLHVLHSSGASFDLGGIYGLPSPLDQFTSYVKMQAASIVGKASTQSFGAGTGRSVASAPDVVQALNALQSQIAALITAIGAIPAGGAALATVSAQLASSAAVLTATAKTIPTSTQSS